MTTTNAQGMDKRMASDNGAGNSREAFLGVALCGLLAALGTSIANVALPEIASTFGASFNATQWVVLGYLLAITCLVVAAGAIGDAVGRERLLRVGLLVFTAASGACALAPNMWVLVASRVLQGGGAAILLAMSLALVGGLVPRKEMGKGLGLYGAMSALGTAMGPSLGGWLLELLGWRSVFGLTAFLGLVATVMVWQAFPVRKSPSGSVQADFDFPGTLLLATTLGCFSLSMMLRADGYGVVNGVLMMASVCSGFLFVIAERRAAAPIVRLATLRSPCLRRDLILTSVVSTVMMATLVVGPFYLSHALHLRPGVVGLVMSVGPVVVMAIGMPVGRWVDKTGIRKAVWLGLVAIGAGAALLCALIPYWQVKGYLVAVVFMTLGYGVFQTANNTGILKQAPAPDRGAIAGLMNLARNLGLILGSAVMGSLFSMTVGGASSLSLDVEALEKGVQVVFASASLVVGMSVLFLQRLVCTGAE